MTEPISNTPGVTPEDPLALDMDSGYRVAPDPGFRATLRDRLVSVAVPPPATGTSGTEVQPWLPVLALAVGALVLGIFIAGRPDASGTAPPPAPTARALPDVLPVQPATIEDGDQSGNRAVPASKPVQSQVAPTDAAAQPEPLRQVATAASSGVSPTDVVAVPSANAVPTKETDEDEVAPTDVPSPSPTALDDQESPPTAVATSTPGPTSRPRPTATPVAPTPGVPSGG